jgi:hypothetical protein
MTKPLKESGRGPVEGEFSTSIVRILMSERAFAYLAGSNVIRCFRTSVLDFRHRWLDSASLRPRDRRRALADVYGGAV